jgi:dihydrofolate reductase
MRPMHVVRWTGSARSSSAAICSGRSAVPGRTKGALEKATLAAKGRDVKIGGGVETVRQYLRAGLIDELHFALSPVVLGQGEAMFAEIDLPALGYRVTEHQATDHATHIVLGR